MTERIKELLDKVQQANQDLKAEIMHQFPEGTIVSYQFGTQRRRGRVTWVKEFPFFWKIGTITVVSPTGHKQQLDCRYNPNDTRVA